MSAEFHDPSDFHDPAARLPAFCKACAEPLDPARSLGTVRGYALLRCPACGTVTIDPWPTLDELTDYYKSSDRATDFNKEKDHRVARAQRRIDQMIALAPGKTFLAVGSRYGFSVKAAQDLGLQAHGIDFDAHAVAASTAAFGPWFETATAHDYMTRGGRADIVYASDIVGRVPDPQAFMASIAGILNPGGVLFVATPDAGHMLVPRNFATWDAVIPPEQITYFTQRGLRTLCEINGLRVKRFGLNLKPGLRLTALKSR